MLTFDQFVNLLRKITVLNLGCIALIGIYGLVLSITLLYGASGASCWGFDGTLSHKYPERKVII